MSSNDIYALFRSNHCHHYHILVLLSPLTPLYSTPSLPPVTVFQQSVQFYRFVEALPLLESSATLSSSFNRRTLDLLGARLFALWGLAAERHGGTAGLAALRPSLLAFHRTSCVRHDVPGQEVLLNLLLRSYLSERLYAQAERLRSRAPLPEGTLGARSNAQQARYLHYLGRIRAVHLECECF